MVSSEEGAVLSPPLAAAVPFSRPAGSPAACPVELSAGSALSPSSLFNSAASICVMDTVPGGASGVLRVLDTSPPEPLDVVASAVLAAPTVLPSGALSLLAALSAGALLSTICGIVDVADGAAADFLLS